MHTQNTVILAAIAIVAGIVSVSTVIAATTAQAQQEDIISAIAGGFESISVVQNADTITITITKTGGEAPPPADNGTVPTDPIIILPPNNETGQNGTVIVPEPLPPTNETQVPTDNQTAPPVVEPPVIIVEPPGNVTQVEPPSNVTVIDNGTVVIAPPDQPVTETPGNVTVIDPPVVNATEPGTPGDCGCPIGVEGGAPDIQFPGSNVTMENETTIIRPDTEPGEESGGNGNGNGNGNSDSGGG